MLTALSTPEGNTEAQSSMRSTRIRRALNVRAFIREINMPYGEVRHNKEQSISRIIQDTKNSLNEILETMEWAEEEIESARNSHPDIADTLHHSFSLLVPSSELMSTEFVYRSHAAELLERVAAGGDTRLATASEVCCVLCTVSQVAPLSSAASGLYCRMWAMAFPDKPMFWESGTHHEALEGSRIDGLETIARRKASVADRTLTGITCKGWHHGEEVTCRYAARRKDQQLRFIS